MRMWETLPEGMKRALQDEAVTGPRATLNPRDAFYGGRTNATLLFYQTSGDEKIQYVGFCSLYPYTNKYCSYPLYHPEIITENSKDVSDYYCLIKCSVLPPPTLYHPLLPYRSGGKLTFPLCRTCVETQQQTPCEHTDNERVLHGTWVSIELEKAIELGYKVVKMEVLWHFSHSEQYNTDAKTGGLFTEYINTFLKLKVEASGWPGWVKTESDKAEYIERYFDKEGIRAKGSG